MVFVKPNKKSLWACIRHSEDGYEYIDSEAMSCLLEDAKAKADNDNKRMPVWAQSNKILGYMEVSISPVGNKIIHET